MVITLLQAFDEGKGMTLLLLKSIEATAVKEITASSLSLDYHLFLMQTIGNYTSNANKILFAQDFLYASFFRAESGSLDSSWPCIVYLESSFLYKKVEDFFLN